MSSHSVDVADKMAQVGPSKGKVSFVAVPPGIPFTVHMTRG